jgi:adenine phosphoribosyltransferase
VDLSRYVRRVADFPRPGITFIDLTPLMADAGALAQAVTELADRLRPLAPDRVVSPEARGFWFGVPVAVSLGVGFTPVRKGGRLPAERIGAPYTLEYGTDVLEVHADGVRPGERVAVVDDLLATGGTAATVADLVGRLGGRVVAAAFAVALTDVPTRDERLAAVPILALWRTEERGRGT